jgi:hypothetical protein
MAASRTSVESVIGGFAMNEMVGCLRCGWVARSDSFDGARRKCGDCGGRVDVIDLPLARKLVGARRNADARRRVEQVSSDLGLERNTRGLEAKPEPG